MISRPRPPAVAAASASAASRTHSDSVCARGPCASHPCCFLQAHTRGHGRGRGRGRGCGRGCDCSVVSRAGPAPEDRCPGGRSRCCRSRKTRRTSRRMRSRRWRTRLRRGGRGRCSRLFGGEDCQFLGFCSSICYSTLLSVLYPSHNTTSCKITLVRGRGRK